jgi:hypothetical protein
LRGTLNIGNPQQSYLYLQHKIHKNGKEYYFNSITEAAKVVGVTPGAIVFAIKNQSKCCNSDWKYR